MSAEALRSDFDVVAFGAMNVDYIAAGPTHVAELDRLEGGREREIQDYSEFEELRKAIPREPRAELGGSALNTIRALGELASDLNLGLVAAKPRPWPDEVSLRALPDNVTVLPIEYTGPPGSGISVLRDGDRRLVTYNDEQGVKELLFDQRETTVALLARARVLHISSVFHPQSLDAVSEIIEEVRARRQPKEVIVAVDPGQVWAEQGAQAHKVLRHADLIFTNQEELAELGGYGGEARAVQHVMNELRAPARGVVILKRKAVFDEEEPATPGDTGRATRTGASFYGASGRSRRAEPRHIIQEALPQQLIVNSTGAGDVFAAGVLASMFSPGVQLAAGLRLGNAAARYKLQRSGDDAYAGLDRVLYEETLPAARGKVFISHAETDRELVDALVSLLGGGAKSDQFYCSSLAGHHAGPGSAFAQDVYTNLRSARLALFVITDTFFKRRWCLYEVGVASALRIPSVPLLAPGYEFDDPGLPVNEFRGGHLDSLEFLVELRKHVAPGVGASSPSVDDVRGFAEVVIDRARDRRRRRRRAGPLARRYAG